MYCPNCGTAEQSPETYCRRCGTFLPDLSKPVKREATPEENLKVNTVLTSMTVVVSFSLAIALYVFLGFRAETHPLIYVTAGLLVAMGGWHIQTFIRTRQLRRQWMRKYRSTRIESGDNAGTSMTGIPQGDNLLTEPANDTRIIASVTEDTTRHLDTKRHPG